MNILVINPANQPYTNLSILAEPIDVLQIATILNEKYSNVKVVDMDGERLKNNLNLYLENENIVIFVYDYHLPLHTSLAIDNIKEVIDSCHQKCHFIVIGKSSTYYYQKFLDLGVDIIIKGICDTILIPLIQCLISKKEFFNIPNLIYKKNNNVIFTKSEELYPSIANLPIPNRDFVNINNYMDTRTMITSRGCIGKCQFCTTPSFFSKWSGKNVMDVVDEIELLVKKYGAKKIMFLDDNATVDKTRMFGICKEIERRNIHCLFGCLASIPTYQKDLFLRMYEVGFRWVHFGLESGSNKILKKMQKILPIDISKKIISEVKDMGYRVRTSFILDYPGTTIDDLKKTKELILAIEPHEIRFHYLAYRVGTPLFNEQKKNDCSQYIHSNFSDYCTSNMNLEISSMLKELEKRGYIVIKEDIDFTQFNNKDKNMKIAAFTPIKYGMCWYE